MATFTNQATLSYNNTTTTSNIVTGELVEVLTATKTALIDSYSQSDSITYIISLINSGTTALTGVTITDDLGTYDLNPTTNVTPLTYIANSIQYYSNGVLQSTPSVTIGPPLVISNISIPANGNAIIIYQALVNSFAPLGTTASITNTATISNYTLFNDVIATETIVAADSVNLSITKSITPESVVENGQITYTFTIQNTGNTAAVSTDNVIITDTFNPILNPITVTYEGTTWSSPTNYTYDTTTGLFQTNLGQITVPAATFTQNPTTGEWTLVPGSVTLRVTGTI